MPALLAQARDNLTGNARDLWIAGARTMRQQATALRTLGGQLGADAPEAVSAALRDAQRATQDFVVWLNSEAPSKTGPSGVGKSVLLKHINGLLHPDAGEVWVDGTRLSSADALHAEAPVLLGEDVACWRELRLTVGALEESAWTGRCAGRDAAGWSALSPPVRMGAALWRVTERSWG